MTSPSTSTDSSLCFYDFLEDIINIIILLEEKVTQKSLESQLKWKIKWILVGKVTL